MAEGTPAFGAGYNHGRLVLGNTKFLLATGTRNYGPFVCTLLRFKIKINRRFHLRFSFEFMRLQKCAAFSAEGINLRDLR